ncbi:MAG: hypothetical protein V4539_03870 [Bacteroidota bacterium]
MKHFKIGDETHSYTIRHMAYCKTCHFEGPWHAKESDAETDAADHIAEPGKDDHDVRIRTEQTTDRLFGI